MWKIAKTFTEVTSGRIVSVRPFTAGLLLCSENKNRSNLHLTPTVKFSDPDDLTLPTNIEEINAGEKSRFSPRRARDLSGSTITFQQTSGSFGKSFMSDQTVVVGHISSTAMQGSSSEPQDAHIESYDDTAVLSLNSVMQSTVPQPYNAPGTETVPKHQNLHGGSWSQGQKFLSEDLQSTHFKNLSHKIKDGEGGVRKFCTAPASPENKAQPEDRKGKLKRLVKEYGATVVIFHTGISLLSLGSCYMAVSSGLDVASILKSIGVNNEFVENTVASGAGTFVVAYAIHKIFVPVRMSITAAATPFIVQYLRKVGVLKTPTKSI